MVWAIQVLTFVPEGMNRPDALVRNIAAFQNTAFNQIAVLMACVWPF